MRVAVGVLVVLLGLAATARGARAEASGALLSGLKRSTLPSGLSVWTLERPASRTVSYRVLVRVGFRDETEDTYGLAHFTEHWMFTDTAKHSEDEVKAIVSDLGGRWNGVTHIDRTVYECDLPATAADAGIEWLGEILGSSRFRPELEDRVRREVREEYRNYYAVLPGSLDLLRQWTGWGTSADRASAALFPSSSVVLRSTRLGPVLDELTVAQAQALYRKYYVPSNLVVVAVGQVSHEHLVELVQRDFASLQQGPAPDFPLRTEVPRAGRRLEFSESVPCLRSERGFAVVFRTDGRRNPRRVESVLVLRILRHRLEKDLIYEQAYLESIPMLRLEAADLGVAAFYSLHDAEHDAAIRASFERHVRDLAEHGPSAEEIESGRRELAGALVRATEDNPDMVETLVELANAFSADQSLPDPGIQLREATDESIRSVAANLLGPANQLWLTWTPAFSVVGAAELFGIVLAGILGLWWWRRRKRRLGVARGAAILALCLTHSSSWSAEPLPIERGTLDGGPEVWLSRRTGTQTVAVELLVRVGSRDESESLAGSTEVLRELILAGGAVGDEESTKRFIERLGGSWWCWGDKEVTHLGVHLPADQLDAGLTWLGKVVAQPTFPPQKLADYGRLVLRQRQWDELLDLLWFGGRLDRMLRESVYAGCGLARDGRATGSTMAQLDSEKLRQIYASSFRRESMTLLVVGPVELPDLLKRAGAPLGMLPAGRSELIRPPCSEREPPDATLPLTDRWPRLTSRTPVRVGSTTAGAADADRWALIVARTMLSKTIFETLRNRLGLVYGARAVNEVYSDRGLFYLEGESEGSNREILAGAMLDLLRALAEKVDPSEVSRAKQRLLGAYLRRSDSNLALLGTLASVAALQPPGLEPIDPLTAIESVTPDSVQAAMHHLLARPLFIAQADPILTGRGILLWTAFVCILPVLVVIIRRRRRRYRPSLSHAASGGEKPQVDPRNPAHPE